VVAPNGSDASVRCRLDRRRDGARHDGERLSHRSPERPDYFNDTAVQSALADPTPEYVRQSIFYNGGLAVTGNVDRNLDFSSRVAIGGFHPYRTHIVPAGYPARFLTYQASNGLAAFGRLKSTDGSWVNLSVFTLPTGWTHIVPLHSEPSNFARLLLYRASDGIAQVDRVDLVSGAYAHQTPPFQLNPGWTHIVHAGGGQLLFYRSGDGMAVTGRVAENGTYANLVLPFRIDSGWTHIITAPGAAVIPASGRMLFYRTGTTDPARNAAVYPMAGDGRLGTKVNVGGFQTDWTHVVATGDGEVLLYRASDGLALTGEVTDSVLGGTFRTGQRYQLTPGWTLISDSSWETRTDY
jgi:hypothetical protein